MIVLKHDFLIHTNLDAQTLDLWIAEEWLMPDVMQDDMRFSEVDIARAKFIGELIDSLGINAEGVGVILNLVDQIHSLRNAVAEKLKIEQK